MPLIFSCDLKGLSPLLPVVLPLGRPGVQSRVKGALRATCAGKWARPKPCLPEAGGATGGKGAAEEARLSAQAAARLDSHGQSLEAKRFH